MITTSIIPTSQRVQIEVEVPQEFVGEEVTVTMFVEQKQRPEHIAPKTMKDFWGIISPETAEEMQAYVKQSREEWNRDFS